MLRITLVDGSQKEFDHPVTVGAVAQSIGSGLARAAIAGKVNDQLVDTSFLIQQDSTLKIITATDEAGLEVIRHSAAHLLAQAVKTLYPSAQVTIGPVIADGFYYDFAFERAFTPEDLERIEKKMQELVKANLPISRREISREDAIKLFFGLGEHYKVDIIKSIADCEVLTLYQQGDFVDLCRGPHVPSTGVLKAFKLTKLAGAYWRGDSNNEMLQRIYGTAWGTKEALAEYLHRLEEAEKRDHRVVGKKMDLFHLQPEAPGSVFWHPKGWQLVLTIREYLRDLLRHHYQEVNTPQLVDGRLWELSGHKAKFNDDMFASFSENREYIVKPMNCPVMCKSLSMNCAVIASYRSVLLSLVAAIVMSLLVRYMVLCVCAHLYKMMGMFFVLRNRSIKRCINSLRLSRNYTKTLALLSFSMDYPRVLKNASEVTLCGRKQSVFWKRC